MRYIQLISLAFLFFTLFLLFRGQRITKEKDKRNRKRKNTRRKIRRIRKRTDTRRKGSASNSW